MERGASGRCCIPSPPHTGIDDQAPRRISAGDLRHQSLHPRIIDIVNADSPASGKAIIITFIWGIGPSSHPLCAAPLISTAPSLVDVRDARRQGPCSVCSRFGSASRRSPSTAARAVAAHTRIRADLTGARERSRTRGGTSRSRGIARALSTGSSPRRDRTRHGRRRGARGCDRHLPRRPAHIACDTLDVSAGFDSWTPRRTPLAPRRAPERAACLHRG